MVLWLPLVLLHGVALWKALRIGSWHGWWGSQGKGQGPVTRRDTPLLVQVHAPSPSPGLLPSAEWVKSRGLPGRGGGSHSSEDHRAKGRQEASSEHPARAPHPAPPACCLDRSCFLSHWLLGEKGTKLSSCGKGGKSEGGNR